MLLLHKQAHDKRGNAESLHAQITGSGKTRNDGNGNGNGSGNGNRNGNGYGNENGNGNANSLDLTCSAVVARSTSEFCYRSV